MTMMLRGTILLAAAFLLFVAFQSFELVREHANLETAFAGQQTPLDQTAQVQRDAESLAGDTAVLADKGNVNAQQIVEEMRHQGITLRAPPAPAATPAP
jgi:hypothetical protein